MNQTVITEADQFVTELALQECHLPKVQPGSVLVAITGQGKTRGMAVILSIESTINQHVVYITPKIKYATHGFLHLELTAAYAELRRISDDAGSTKGALTCGNLTHFRLALPPLEEQQAIFASIEHETAGLTKSLSQIEAQIRLIAEYRTRLIADVVTGKLDVREAAARLPDEQDEPDAADDLLLEGEEFAEDAEIDAMAEEVDV